MYTTVLGIAISFVVGPAAPPLWHADYAKAHAEATASDKPLFIVICPGSSDYAQMMGLGMFLNESIERSLCNDYARCLIDTDTPEGKELATKFDAETGPRFVIIDRSGKWQVYYHSGILLETDLAPVLARYRRAKLTPAGRPAERVATARRQTVQLCST